MKDRPPKSETDDIIRCRSCRRFWVLSYGDSDVERWRGVLPAYFGTARGIVDGYSGVCPECWANLIVQQEIVK